MLVRTYPLPRMMPDQVNVAWEFALIDTEYGSEGFYFNTSGLQWSETEGGFNGWLGTLCSFLGCH